MANDVVAAVVSQFSRLAPVFTDPDQFAGREVAGILCLYLQVLERLSGASCDESAGVGCADGWVGACVGQLGEGGGTFAAERAKWLPYVRGIVEGASTSVESSVDGGQTRAGGGEDVGTRRLPLGVADGDSDGFNGGPDVGHSVRSQASCGLGSNAPGLDRRGGNAGCGGTGSGYVVAASEVVAGEELSGEAVSAKTLQNRQRRKEKKLRKRQADRSFAKFPKTPMSWRASELQGDEASTTLRQVWAEQNKLRLKQLASELKKVETIVDDDEGALRVKQLADEQKVVDLELKLENSKQRLAVLRARDVKALTLKDKVVNDWVVERSKANIIRTREGLDTQRSQTKTVNSKSISPSSSVSNKERNLEKKVQELESESAGLRAQIEVLSVSNSIEAGREFSLRELALEKQNKELMEEVKNLKSKKHTVSERESVKVYHKERDRVYQEYQKLLAENKQLKSGAGSASGSVQNDQSARMRELTLENDNLRQQVQELRMRPTVKDGLTTHQISQLSTWGVEEVNVKRRWL